MRCSCNYPAQPHEVVDDRMLRPGDMVYVLGWKRITAIRPYKGPLPFIIGLAETVPGGGFSLIDNGTTKRSLVEGWEP